MTAEKVNINHCDTPSFCAAHTQLSQNAAARSSRGWATVSVTLSVTLFLSAVCGEMQTNLTVNWSVFQRSNQLFAARLRMFFASDFAL